MPYVAVEPCSQCGKPIDLKNVRSYRVLDDYRAICIECFKAKPDARTPESERKQPPEKKR